MHNRCPNHDQMHHQVGRFPSSYTINIRLHTLISYRQTSIFRSHTINIMLAYVLQCVKRRYVPIDGVSGGVEVVKVAADVFLIVAIKVAYKINTLTNMCILVTGNSLSLWFKYA